MKLPPPHEGGNENSEDAEEGGDILADRPDLRMPLVGVAGWVGGLAAYHAPTWALLGAAGLIIGALVVLWTRSSRALALTTAGITVVAVAVASATLLRQEAVGTNPVSDLAQERAAVTISGTLLSDPRLVAGQFTDQVLARLEVRSVTGRGTTHRLATPVLVLGDRGWLPLALGSTVRATGLLVPADDPDLAALLTQARDPVTTAPPDVWWRGSSAVRASIRGAVAHRPDDERALVPALVDGDDAGLDEALAADFRETGLTHLTAVSGTNLTLVVGFLLVLARWSRVRGRWLYLVGAVGIVGFVLLARTEPSVLRAAVMGTVGLLAMGVNGRHRAARALGVAVLVLLLVQPGLAVSVGFALSVLATAGIVVLGPGLRDASARWLPRPVAEAVAVPLAAQLACTPLVAAISGQVSLVAVGANLLVAPVVGPATVLGLAAGLLGLVAEPLGRVCGTLAGWCVSWIVAVAERGAALPTASVGWGAGGLALALLTALTLAVSLLAPRILRRPVTALVCTGVLVLVVVLGVPRPGWPAAGWVLAMCDVGQGEALVLNAGPGAAVVVDVGPDPAAMADCLSALDIDRVPLVVLTHFHADHVDGLAGVTASSEVGRIETTSMLDPPGGVGLVRSEAEREGVSAALVAPGETRRYGEVTLQVLWPRSAAPETGPGDGSSANDASVVLLAEVRGVRILLTGEIGPAVQGALARSLPDLRVDVLKVPHHGSRYQDLSWLTSLHAEVALVSVGADNTYGHPSTDVLEPLTAAGADVHRTDEEGDVLVVADSDGVSVRSAGP